MMSNIQKKAFSLLEVIVALAVIAVIAGLGYSGLINFRSTSEMQNVYSEFVSNLRTLQNKAKNSINISNGNNQAPDIYTMAIGPSDYVFYHCNKISTFSDIIQCTQEESIIKKNIPTTITLKTDPNCIGIGFVRLTGKIVSVDFSATAGQFPGIMGTKFSSAGDCKITISSNTIVSTKVIKISFDTGSISL